LADVKISGLPASTTPLAGSEVLPVVQGTTTKQVSVSNLTAGRAVSAASLALTSSPLPVASGGSGTATAFTAGSVVFAGTSGVYSQKNANFFWDNSNNRLGINTGSPVLPLDVRGAIYQNDGASNTYIQQADGTNNVYTALNPLGIPNSFGITSPDAIPIIFGNSNLERLRVTATGDVSIANGNLVIGTSGKGIDFSATAGTGTSELLADYEEGTWTPTLALQTPGDSAFTYTTQLGFYTKVGRIVTVSAAITVSNFSNSTGTGNLRMAGFPFSNNATLQAATSNFASVNGFTTSYPNAARIPNGQSIAVLQSLSPIGAFVELNNLNVTSSSTFLFTGVYQTS
jgi:hypothetical protein